MSAPGYARRRHAAVLVVGAAEPEVPSWLRAAGYGCASAPDAATALDALGADPRDLVIADRGAEGEDVAAVCAALRADGRLRDAWLLAVTDASAGRMAAAAALEAGADDYLDRPFTRPQLLARARAGLRAAAQRSDDSLLRSLMATVPGAIYRSAWHDGHRIELIGDEIERISGYPPANFIASDRRTLMSIVHPEDRDAVLAAVQEAGEQRRPFVLEYRIVRADGGVRWVLDRGQLVPGGGERLWMDGAIFDVTERREAQEALRLRELEEARTAELRASRARIVEAADAARRKIERDLHDGAQQRLVALVLDARLARAQYRRDAASVGPFLERLGDELAEASAELRELARGIHPAVLTDQGLGPAITALASRSPVPVDLLELPGGRLPPVTEATAYFTVAEALTNVAKYAEASHAEVRVRVDGDDLVVEVRDDGIGGAEAGAGSGLSGLADRVGACDGTLSVSSPPGEGTLVRAVLPGAPAATAGHARASGSSSA